MSTDPDDIARSYVAPGTLWALARNRDITTGAGKLIAQDLGVVTDRPAVSLQWELIAGWPVNHGSVADEAAMLALHTYDSPAGDTPLLRYVAPGDSCTRADDPGWRWHCLSGHGTTLAQWERRPLAATITALATAASGAAGTATFAGISGQPGDNEALDTVLSALGTAISDKPDAPANAAALARISAVAGGPMLWDGVELTGGGGMRGLFSGLLSVAAPSRSNTGLTGWYNQQSSTALELPHALMVSSTAAVSGLSGITGTVASGATITALVSLGRSQTTSYPSLMFGFVDGDQFNGLALYWNSTNGRMVASVTRYSTPTTQVAATTEADYLDSSGPLWLRIRRDSTTMYWECSSTGASWRLVYSEPLSGLYLAAYTTMMFGTSVSGAAPLDAVLHSLTVG